MLQSRGQEICRGWKELRRRIMIFLGPIAKPGLGFNLSGTNPPELTCKLLIFCLRLQERPFGCQIHDADAFLSHLDLHDSRSLSWLVGGHSG